MASSCTSIQRRCPAKPEGCGPDLHVGRRHRRAPRRDPTGALPTSRTARGHLRLYHRTSAEAAAAILVEGFRDGGYRADDETGTLRGAVELSAQPYDSGNLPAAKREVLLAIEVPDDLLEDREWVLERGGRTGEFFVPAELLNRYGPPEVVDEGSAPA